MFSLCQWLTKRVFSFALGCLGLLFLSSAPLYAANGTLTGTVTNASSGQPISGALIQVNRSGSLVASTTTNSSGTYSISVASNTYDVTASATGYV